MVVDKCSRENLKKQRMIKNYWEISEKLHVEGWKKENVNNDTKLLNLRSGMMMLLVEIGKLGKGFLRK